MQIMTDIFYQEVRKWKSAYERKSKTIFIFGVKLNQSISKISAPKLITYISITNIILYQDLPWEVTCMSLSFVLWRKYQYHRRSAYPSSYLKGQKYQMQDMREVPASTSYVMKNDRFLADFHFVVANILSKSKIIIFIKIIVLLYFSTNLQLFTPNLYEITSKHKNLS